MRDINFFEPYIDKKEFQFNGRFIFNIIIILTILLLLSFSIYNQFQIRYLTKYVDELQSLAEDPLIIKRVALIKEKQEEVASFREEVEKIQSLDRAIQGDDYINERLLDDITWKIPENLFLTSLGLNSNSVEILGISKEKWSIAEFSKGLESLEDMESIYISNISSISDYYSFSLSINLKGGLEDHGEIDEEQVDD